MAKEFPHVQHVVSPLQVPLTTLTSRASISYRYNTLIPPTTSNSFLKTSRRVSHTLMATLRSYIPG
jgi:hypothetical protein